MTKNQLVLKFKSGSFLLRGRNTNAGTRAEIIYETVHVKSLPIAFSVNSLNKSFPNDLTNITVIMGGILQ